MYGHDGERMVMVWVLNDKGEKEPASFLVDGYEPEMNTVSISISWMSLAWAYMFKKTYKKTAKEL